MFSFKALAGIQSAGFAGTSQSCLQAVLQIIQYGKRIESVKILSANQAYCLLMKLDFEEIVAIKSGFRSGYAGEGPSTFSKVLGVASSNGPVSIVGNRPVVHRCSVPLT